MLGVVSSQDLSWPDGAIVTATVNTEHSMDEAAVEYAGAVERLPEKWERSCWSFVAQLFKNIARETGGTVSVEHDGVFSSEDDIVFGREGRDRVHRAPLQVALR